MGHSQSDHQNEQQVIEQQQLSKYRHFYKPQHLNHKGLPADDYFAKVAAIRLDIVRAHYKGGRVLDLCCGSGDYLFPVAQFVEHIIGADFSPELIFAAQHQAAINGQQNVAYCVANARSIPLRTASISLVCSFSSLYYIPALEQVMTECVRVLRPGGTAILEFGGLYSLNTIVSRAYPDLAAPCHLPVRTIYQMLSAAGLTIKQKRSFQILPLWGNRPLWLRPLLHPLWKRLLSHSVGNRMLDEVISSSWMLRRMAFRHLIVCQKI